MIVPPSFPLTTLVLFGLAAPRPAQDSVERARKLFVTNCATCHGETGDGKGTTQLDRPARSFMDGGFSFGNTPEQLFKTISTGIPGSPMPAFDSSLSEEERRLLASYVITLGPPIEEVKEEDMILVVHDRPLVVRGKLPALAEGLPEHPRGLLIGDPSGITFEYTVDDVRLLALRQGGFVRRTDWTGRGGTPLEPLGKVVHMVEGGKPEASFLSQGKPLSARLSGTRVSQSAGLVEYHLVQDGREMAHARELPHVLTTNFGTGYQRDLSLAAGGSAVEITFRSPAIEGATVLAQGQNEALFERWQVVRPAEGPPVFVEVESSGKTIRDIGRGQFEASLSLKPGDTNFGFSVSTLVLVDWNDGIRKQLEHWREEK
jgi:mono/diheme cytochrome c family protein